MIYRLLRPSVSKMLPYFGAYLILLGVVKQIIYYQNFGVQIVRYLELSEALTAFMYDIVVFLKLVLYGAIYFLVAFLVIHLLRLLKLSIPTKAFYFFVLASYLFVHEGLEVFSNYSSKRLLTSLAFIGFYATAIWLCLFWSTAVEEVPKTIRFIVLFLLIWLIGVSNSGQKEYYAIKNDKRNYGVVVQLDSLRIVSDSTYYFIGNTQKYLFMYNEKSRTADVYPIERVLELKMPNR